MAIVAGKPDESEMIFRIHSDDEDEVMPRNWKASYGKGKEGA